MDIEQLGKGALPDPIDERDYQFEAVMGAAPIDWSNEFRLPEPPNENQGSSLSCVAQATSYLHWQLRRKDYSRRDLYSEIALPQGGAYLRDGVKRLKDYGQATRDEVPDPSPQTEPGMRDKSGITREKQSSDIEAEYFVMRDPSIEGVAMAVRDYGGGIFGIYGNNEGFKDLTNPTPPQQGKVAWAHALYAMGYHMHDGQKCIIAKSSWCFDNHKEHHIKEDYFTTGMTFNAWVVIPKETMMNEFVETINNKGKVGIVIYADTPENLVFLGKAFNKQITIQPDGTIQTDIVV